MKKKIKIIFKLTALALLAALLISGVWVYRYYPHYIRSREPFDIREVERAKGEVIVMSYNIRLSGLQDSGQRNWLYRANLLIKVIADNEPDIIGFQEVRRDQQAYFKRTLIGYDSVIQYRDWFGPWSEACPIFWRTDKFKLIDCGHFWLSETPERMSFGWDAAIRRVTTWVVLEEIASGERLAVFNTHFDHRGQEARLNSVDVMFSQIEKIETITENTPIMLIGDFNFNSTSPAYEKMTAEHGFLDAAISVDPPVLLGTYNGWRETRGGRIDYIFFSPWGLEILSYKVDNRTFDGVFPSDHDAIIAKFKILS
jgi:endonuclease/exonuclease/phosphatase family metal-dependent hydrolase